jgi:NADH:ubiquinone oxidoreductase subunit F (NADH-binding)
MLQPCHGTRAKDTPRSGKWNANQCPPCRTGHEKTRRIRKREEKKEKTEEKEILRQLVFDAAKKRRLAQVPQQQQQLLHSSCR